MRGQRLFVRPVVPSDHDAVREFLQRYSAASAPLDRAPVSAPVSTTASAPASAQLSGLLGKVVGELAAVLAVTILPSSLRIDDLVVRDDLRKKRIGRFMVGEAAKLAVTMDRALLTVERSGTADEFLRRVGFEADGGQWIRRVS